MQNFDFKKTYQPSPLKFKRNLRKVCKLFNEKLKKRDMRGKFEKQISRGNKEFFEKKILRTKGKLLKYEGRSSKKSLHAFFSRPGNTAKAELM